MSDWNRRDVTLLSTPEKQRKRDYVKSVMYTLAIVIIAGATAGITIFVDRIS